MSGACTADVKVDSYALHYASRILCNDAAGHLLGEEHRTVSQRIAAQMLSEDFMLKDGVDATATAGMGGPCLAPFAPALDNTMRRATGKPQCEFSFQLD